MPALTVFTVQCWWAIINGYKSNLKQSTQSGIGDFKKIPLT